MIKNRITLKQLEAFVAVVDEGSFRRAADALGTTQPNISVRIAGLEDTLGTVLLLRDAGAVRLTDRGGELLTSARDVLRATEQFMDHAARTDLIEDRLRLGVTELVAATWLHAFLRAFRAIYPAVRVELTVDVAQVIAATQDAQEIDLAILNDAEGHRNYATSEVQTDRYVWVTTPQIAEEVGDRVALSALFARPVLTHGRNTAASKALRARAKALGLGLDGIAHSNSLTACLAMAQDGMGISLLPSRLCAGQLSDGTLAQITTDWEPEPLSFISRFDARRAPHFVVRAAALAAETAMHN